MHMYACTIFRRVEQRKTSRSRWGILTFPPHPTAALTDRMTCTARVCECSSVLLNRNSSAWRLYLSSMLSYACPASAITSVGCFSSSRPQRAQTQPPCMSTLGGFSCEACFEISEKAVSNEAKLHPGVSCVDIKLMALPNPWKERLHGKL